MKLDAVIHQARFDVDERTTRAAAATAVTTIEVSGRRMGRNALEFSADKPFLFLLRDDRTGLILFMGRYVAPQAPA